jgi:cytochrome c2
MGACVADPKAIVPGGSMSCAGMRQEEQMNGLRAFLRQATGAPEAP